MAPRLEDGGIGEVRDWTSIDPQRQWRDDEVTIIRVDETEWVLGVESSSGRRISAR